MKALKKVWQTAKKRLKTKWIMMDPEHQMTCIIVGRVAAIIVIGVLAFRVIVK